MLVECQECKFNLSVYGSLSCELLRDIAVDLCSHFVKDSLQTGKSWSKMESGARFDLYLKGVWGSSPTNVYAVARETMGTILQYDGTMWTEMEALTLNRFKAIWGTSATDIFAVGENGMVLHYGCENDGDCDGVLNAIDNCRFLSNSDQLDLDSDGVGDACDNCSYTANGPLMGTCLDANIGTNCSNDETCGPGGTCSKNQEDVYPTLTNGVGDACECEGNFNCSVDQDVDGSDASMFKADFGRSTIVHPCIAGVTCNGDFSCDGDVDGTDASLFKQDFGRSSSQNPCPLCVSSEPWCQYQ